MCNGDAQELDDLRIIHIASMLSNSALAAANLSGDKRRARAWTGGPLVVMKCSTPYLVCDWTKLGVVMSGNSASSKSYWSVELEMASRRGAVTLVELSGTEW